MESDTCDMTRTQAQITRLWERVEGHAPLRGRAPLSTDSVLPPHTQHADSDNVFTAIDTISPDARAALRPPALQLVPTRILRRLLAPVLARCPILRAATLAIQVEWGPGSVFTVHVAQTVPGPPATRHARW